MCWARAPIETFAVVFLNLRKSYYSTFGFGTNNAELYMEAYASATDIFSGKKLVANTTSGSMTERWHHFCLTAWAPTAGVSTVELFLDGMFVGRTDNGNNMGLSNSLQIGSHSFGIYNGHSLIAGVKLFKGVLAHGDFRKEMQSLHPVTQEAFVSVPLDTSTPYVRGTALPELRIADGTANVCAFTGTDNGNPPVYRNESPLMPRYYPKRRIFLPTGPAFAYSRPVSDVAGGSGWTVF
jgi:hypothetical protein